MFFIFFLDGSVFRIIGCKINVVVVSGEKEVKIVVGGNIIIVIGISVEIYCLVIVLFNVIVMWLFNGLIVKKGSFWLFKLKNLVFILRGVILEDIGFYICFVNNFYGEDIRIMFLFFIG